MKIEVLKHASIKLIDNMVIYFDPYDIKEEYHDADYIFITHDHYDHYDASSIDNIKKDNTKIILPECLKEKDNYLVVEPDREYIVDDIKFETIRSYNINKTFHPRNKDYVGYNICLNDTFYYIMGDTDRTQESDNVKTDICFVPIGGVYTMDVNEAIDYINDLKPRKVIPIHYGSIVGDKELGKKFQEGINKEIETEILI